MEKIFSPKTLMLGVAAAGLDCAVAVALAEAVLGVVAGAAAGLAEAPQAVTSAATQVSAAAAIARLAVRGDGVIAGVLTAQGRLREPCDTYDVGRAVVVGSDQNRNVTVSPR